MVQIFLTFLCSVYLFVGNDNRNERPFFNSDVEDIGSKVGHINKKGIFINVMSYNTWGLPIELAGHDHDRRFSKMADSILDKKCDIICLQETFNPRLRSTLSKIIRADYYIHQDYTCHQEIIPFVKKDCYGGLMTYSKFPILKERFYKYPIQKDCSLIEKIGGKGFLFTVIDNGGQKMNIVNTHLYAGNDDLSEKMRFEQIKFMHQQLLLLSEYHLFPTILVGDFNMQHPDLAYSKVYDYIVHKMKFYDSKTKLSISDFTIDATCNPYVDKKEASSKLDYVFYNITSKIKPQIVQQCRMMDSKNPLSDHFAWKVIFKI